MRAAELAPHCGDGHSALETTMTEPEAKRHLSDMLAGFTPGSVLHLLAQVVREAEESRLGTLDDDAEERIREAEAFLWVSGYGLDAALPRS
jgi:hypothetical protein